MHVCVCACARASLYVRVHVYVYARAKMVAGSVAWFLYRLVASVHSGIIGGLICARALMRWANEKKYLSWKHEDTMLDEVQSALVFLSRLIDACVEGRRGGGGGELAGGEVIVYLRCGRAIEAKHVNAVLR